MWFCWGLRKRCQRDRVWGDRILLKVRFTGELAHGRIRGLYFGVGGVVGGMVCLCLMVGCERDSDRDIRADGEVLVLVASSAAEAMGEVAEVFEAETGIAVKVSGAGSNVLAQQVLHGVTADVFVSAHGKWADVLEEKDLVIERRALLGNVMVLIGRKDSGVDSVEDLTGGGGGGVERVALAGEQVPAGMYGEEVLRAAGVYEALVQEQKMVRGQDVRSVLMYVVRGEVDAGVVYASDIVGLDDGVVVVHRFEEMLEEAVVYPAVLLDEGEAAREFYEFLFSEEGQSVFELFGFEGTN